MSWRATLCRHLSSWSVLVLSTLGCDVVPDRSAPTVVSPSECNHGATRACGANLGECSEGTQSCVRGFWSVCEGFVGPSEEVCDLYDNDCDGDVDEGFGVGNSCELPGGCRGLIACAEPCPEGDPSEACDAAAATRCVPDPATAGEEEICDGVDNDCDGWVDLVPREDGADPVCTCRLEELALSPATPERASDLSRCDVGCTEGASGLMLEPCNDFEYAMCVTSTPVDVSPFDISGSADGLLEVDYTVTHFGAVSCAINLWYEQIDSEGERSKIRRYLPLLAVGERPGHFVRYFAPEDVCVPPWEECQGASSGADCNRCGGDTCGALTGPSCNKIDFTRSVLEVAAEWCNGPFEGSVEIHRVRHYSSGCRCAGDEHCSDGLSCRKALLSSQVCAGNQPCVGLCTE